MLKQLAWSTILILGLAAACAPAGERRPDLESNPSWSEPQRDESTGVPVVDNLAPRAWLEVLAATRRVSGTRLLFWGDQAAARDPSGYQFVANAEAHEILMFGPDLQFLGALSPGSTDGDRLQRPQAVAAASGDKLAAFDAAGNLTLFDRWGREFRRLETAFAYTLGTWGPGDRLTVARSPFTIAFALEPEHSPLLLTIDPAHPERPQPLGRTREAIQPLYTHAANAGSVAVDAQGSIYYAALGRPEIRKYSASGEFAWVSQRRIAFETPEPRLVPNPEGTPRLSLATVQKASAFGPDGLLYIRSAANAEATRDQLDVFDSAGGTWLRSAPLDTGTAILVGRRGAIWEIAPDALLSREDRERRTFPSFALPSFRGDTLELEDLRGQVTLVAFWASWCGPCREELPLLDSLERAIDRPDFRVLGINEDVQEDDARSFAETLGLRLTNLLGRGRMRQRYHYSGLPYSVLLDREGRIVREYYGFGGRQAFDREVAGRVLSELGPLSDDPDHASHRHSSPAEAHDHSHGPRRALRGGEIERLADYLPEARRLRPLSGRDLPARHWELVLDGLARVDAESNGFMERFPGTFQLVQLLTLKTQLYVDVERLPKLSDPAEFAASWSEHLTSIGYLLDAYRELHGAS